MPFGKFVANTLKEWKFACPKSDVDLVFPNGVGKIELLANIINRGLIPAQIAAGVFRRWQGKIHRPARASPFLRLMVHQPARGWRAWAAAEDCAGAAGPLLDHHDL